MFFSLLFFGIICRYNFSIKLSPIFIILGTTPSRIDFIPTGCPPMGDKRYTRSFQSKDSTIFLIVSQSTLDNQIRMRSGQKYVSLRIEIFFSRMQQLFLFLSTSTPGKWIQYYGQPSFEKDAYFTVTGHPLQPITIFKASMP